MSNDEHELVQAEGTIERTGMTTYMYGDYKLVASSGETAYALRSSIRKLSEFVGQYVEITGRRVPGYPIEGGPIYLEVEIIMTR